jgi:hypothetical protein
MHVITLPEFFGRAKLIPKACIGTKQTKKKLKIPPLEDAFVSNNKSQLLSIVSFVKISFPVKHLMHYYYAKTGGVPQCDLAIYI